MKKIYLSRLNFHSFACSFPLYSFISYKSHCFIGFSKPNVEQGGVAGLFARVAAFFFKIGKWITSLFGDKAT